jgi:hypothetical protein
VTGRRDKGGLDHLSPDSVIGFETLGRSLVSLGVESKPHHPHMEIVCLTEVHMSIWKLVKHTISKRIGRIETVANCDHCNRPANIPARGRLPKWTDTKQPS